MYIGDTQSKVTDVANKIAAALTNPFGMSAPKSIPKPVNDPNNLDEVVVTATRRLPVEEDLPEIVSTGVRIQWWQWLLAGAAGVALFNSLRR